jgi:hypothetical protein
MNYQVAIHEAGHAVISYRFGLDRHDGAGDVTIVPCSERKSRLVALGLKM